MCNGRSKKRKFNFQENNSLEIKINLYNNLMVINIYVCIYNL